MKRAELGVVAAVAVAFAALAWVLAHRLTNGWFGDVEFTGWSSPLAMRLVAGERPYQDFVAPLPPGSWLVLAAAQRWAGVARLQQELLLLGACHLAMGLLGWGTLRLLAGPRVALLALGPTLALLATFNKECAYDHTAQVAAWASLAAGVRGLLLAESHRRVRWLAAAGLLAGLTHLFKQSTGLGVGLGWGAAFAWLALVTRGSPEAWRRRARDLGAFTAGLLAGFALTLLVVAVAGGSVGGFLQAVYRDGADLKGGTSRLLFNLTGYAAWLTVYPGSLIFVLGLAFLVARTSRAPGGFRLHEPGEAASASRVVTASALLAGAAFLSLAAFIEWGPPGFPEGTLAWSEPVKMLPSLALPLLALCFFQYHGEARAGEASPVGLAANAGILVAVGSSLLHNTSAPEFRAFYDNNPLLFLALGLILRVVLRATGSALPAFVLALVCLVSLLTGRFDRAARADIPVTEGYWSGLRVGGTGLTLHEVAAVVRRHVAPEETVLILPEDLALAPAIGRPRPRLRGAVAFVDQYPESALAADLAELAARPPKALVLHPEEEMVWRTLYRIWSANSPAERLLEAVRRELLPRYRLVETRSTRFLRTRTTLQVWVRRD